MILEGNITGFQHLGLPVSDMETSTGFYEKLGFSVSSEELLEDDTGTTAVRFLELEGFCLEIYQPAGGKDPARGATGPVDHIALRVNDVDLAFSELKGKGYRIIEEAPVFLPMHRRGVRYFNILGPDREKIEFVQIL